MRKFFLELSGELQEFDMYIDIVLIVRMFCTKNQFF